MTNLCLRTYFYLTFVWDTGKKHCIWLCSEALLSYCKGLGASSIYFY